MNPKYFDDIQDVKVTKDMLDLAKHIVNQKAGDFESEKFEDHHETVELINQKRAGKTIAHKPRPRGENVVDLMYALKHSISVESAPKEKNGRKASSGQKELLMSVSGTKKPAKQAAKKKSDRRSA